MDYKVSKPKEHKEIWSVFVGNENNLECPIEIERFDIFKVQEGITTIYYLKVPVMIAVDVSVYNFPSYALNEWKKVNGGKVFYSFDKHTCERLFKQELLTKKEKMIKKIRKLAKVLDQIEKIEEENNLIPTY